MSDKIQGLKMEVDFIIKDQNILRYLESVKKASSSAFGSVEKDIKKSDKMLNNFSIKLKNLDFFRLQNSFSTISTYFKSLEKDIDKAINKNNITQSSDNYNIRKQKIDKKTNKLPIKKEEIPLLDYYSSSISSISLAIDSLGSDKLTKFFAPLKKGNAVIINLKKINTELKKITQVDGKFNFFKTFKFSAFAIGLSLVTYLMGKFTDYLSNNKKIQESWKKVVESTKKLLSTVGKATLEFIFALLGIDSKNLDEGIAGTFDKITIIIDKLTDKMEKLREWIDKNKDKIKEWGNALKEWGPTLAQASIFAWMLVSPLSLIVVFGASIPSIVEETKKSSEDIKKLKEERDKLVKEGMDPIKADKIYMDKVNKHTRDSNEKMPVIGPIFSLFNPILEIFDYIINQVWYLIDTFLSNTIGKLFEYFVKINWFDVFKGLWDIINWINGCNLGQIIGEGIAQIPSILNSAWRYARLGFDFLIKWIRENIWGIADFFTELCNGVIPFNKLLEQGIQFLKNIRDFSGMIIEIFINYIKNGTMEETTSSTINAASNGFKSFNEAFANVIDGKATGTNYFSGGLTTINEQGDELILGPTGMIVANNPSTMNIMRSLATMDGNISQIKFGINGDSGRVKANNITINIGNISNRSDIDYLARQISMLDLS